MIEDQTTHPEAKAFEGEQALGRRDSPRRRGRPAVGRHVQRRDVIGLKKKDADINTGQRGTGTKLIMVAERRGVPLGVRSSLPSLAKVRLIESTLELVDLPLSGPRSPRTKPRRPIDKAIDSNVLRLRLKTHGVELLCPHYSNRKRPLLEHGRCLHRYRLHWTIETFIVWLGNFHRMSFGMSASPMCSWPS